MRSPGWWGQCRGCGRPRQPPPRHPRARATLRGVSKFGELKAEIAELRGRVTTLVWVVGGGFAAVIAASAIFRYLG